MKTTAPTTPSPDPAPTNLHNQNMSDFGSDTPLTTSWNEEEADEEADLRT